MDRTFKNPPSRRKVPHDWKEVVAEVVTKLVVEQCRRRPLEGQTKQRAAIISHVRMALDTSLPSRDLANQVDGQEFVTPSEIIRIILQRAGYDWRTPVAAESVMVVAQRAVDAELASLAGSGRNDGPTSAAGRPLTWQDQLRYVVAMVFKVESARSVEDRRAKLWDDFERALSDESSADWVALLPVPGRDVKEAKPEQCVTPPALFRMALWNEDIDWYEPVNRVQADEVVRAAIDGELANH